PRRERRPTRRRSSQLSDLGLDRAHERAVADRAGDRLDVVTERTVLAQPRRELAHERADRPHADAGLERRVELDALRAGEQLDRERALAVRKHLPRLESGRI